MEKSDSGIVWRRIGGFITVIHGDTPKNIETEGFPMNKGHTQPSSTWIEKQGFQQC